MLASQISAKHFINTLFGEITIGRARSGYTTQFEPWFCRIPFELDVDVVGIDFGDLTNQLFTHYQVDLGKIGASNFLPDHSYDAVQDNRLFGSPEFAAPFTIMQNGCASRRKSAGK